MVLSHSDPDMPLSAGRSLVAPAGCPPPLPPTWKGGLLEGGYRLGDASALHMHLVLPPELCDVLVGARCHIWMFDVKVLLEGLDV